MKKVLVTGGLGFIGSNYIKTLLTESDMDINILDNLSSQIHGDVFNFPNFLDNSRIKLFRGSINDKFLVKKALIDVDIVIHLAAETGTGQSMYEISSYNYVNSQGTAVLLEEILNLQQRPSRIILASSRSVYGEGLYLCQDTGVYSNPNSRNYESLSRKEWNYYCSNCDDLLVPKPTSEDTICKPASMYAVTKKNQEDMIVTFCAANKIDFSILRFQNVYGEGQSLQNPYTGILSIFSNRLRANDQIPIFEDGQMTRDFVHVSDVVNSMMLSTFYSEKISKIMNVGSGIGSKIIDVAEMLKVEFDSLSKIVVTEQFRVGDIRNNCADLTLISEVLDYSPRVTLADGISLFAEWVLNQDVYDDKLDMVNDELRAKNLMG